ncbi:hypothetical protein BC941DRAFT_432288 [Chlamydoabsidia padenii]|nr:hypothetical protein BC941DRAFT_432288 [Chlamydoabsidia padenii]
MHMGTRKEETSLMMIPTLATIVAAAVTIKLNIPLADLITSLDLVYQQSILKNWIILCFRRGSWMEGISPRFLWTNDVEL